MFFKTLSYVKHYTKAESQRECFQGLEPHRESDQACFH